MKKIIAMKLCGLGIEWNWRCIKKYRRKADLLLGGGLTSIDESKKQRILELSEKANNHANRVMELQNRYYNLAGINLSKSLHTQNLLES